MNLPFWNLYWFPIYEAGGVQQLFPIQADLRGKMVIKRLSHPGWLLCVHDVVLMNSWAFRKTSRTFSNWNTGRKGCFAALLFLELQFLRLFSSLLKLTTLCVRWQDESNPGTSHTTWGLGFRHYCLGRKGKHWEDISVELKAGERRVET